MTARPSPQGRRGGRRPLLTPDELRSVYELASRRAGLGFSADDGERVERAVRDRMRQLGLDDARGYLRRLLTPGDDDEPERLVERLLNHETYFFRELPQLQAFGQHVLPDLAETCRDGRLLLWSAGCSTGEEAYTLAMMVLDSGLFEGWQVRILGTDVSRQVVAAARRGLYGRTSFRAIPDGWRARYFHREGDRHEVVARVRSLCHFAQLNLLDESRIPLLGQADAIFCRNVLIHLDDAARSRVLATFHERLRPGGWLLLGHSETMLPAGTPFLTCSVGAELLHRRDPVSDLSGEPGDGGRA